MKKIAFIALALTAACVSTFAASFSFPITLELYEEASQNLTVINILDLSDDDLNEIMQGKRPEVAVEFPAETTLPISFLLQGNLVNLSTNEENLGQLVIMQTLYVRHAEEELLFSTNLNDWKPFKEFAEGNLSVMLSMQDGQLSISVGVETNLRYCP